MYFGKETILSAACAPFSKHTFCLPGNLLQRHFDAAFLNNYSTPVITFGCLTSLWCHFTIINAFWLYEMFLYLYYCTPPSHPTLHPPDHMNTWWFFFFSCLPILLLGTMYQVWLSSTLFSFTIQSFSQNLNTCFPQACNGIQIIWIFYE